MADGIALVNLNTGQSWVFPFFPREIEAEDQSNWRAREDVSIGTQPLQYENRSPRRIEIPEFWLDGTETGDSVEPDIQELRELLSETDMGVPPTLRYICGADQLRVVPLVLRVRLSDFNYLGQPLRARVSLTLLEYRQVERVTVKTSDPDDPGGMFGG